MTHTATGACVFDDAGLAVDDLDCTLYGALLGADGAEAVLMCQAGVDVDAGGGHDLGQVHAEDVGFTCGDAGEVIAHTTCTGRGG